MSVAALEHQLFDHVFVSKTGSSCNTDIYPAFSAKSLDIIRSLSALGISATMTVLPLMVCKVMSGIIAGSQLSDTALAIASIFLNTASLSKPITSLVLSAIPKMILPPVPLAKANYRLHIFDAFFRQILFELHIL